MRVFLYEYACALARTSLVPDNMRCEGRAMREALAQDLGAAGVELITLDHVAPQEESRHFFARLAYVDAAWIIAPELERILVTRCAWVEQAGVRLLGTPVRVLSWLVDKWQQYKRLQKAGVPVPLSRIEPPSLSGDRWICKPRWGAGSYQVRWWETPHQEPSNRLSGSLLWQRYVPGVAASIAVICGPTQRIILRGASQELSNDGRFSYLGGRLPLAGPLENRACLLAEKVLDAVPELRGYIGIDMVLGAAQDGSEDYVIEINPRLTTSYLGQRALCQHNLAELTLRLLNGEHVNPPTWRKGYVKFDIGGNVIWASRD